MRVGLILSLLLAIVAVLFAVQNPQPMDVHLLFFETQGSTALVLILTFGLGVVVGLLSSLPGRLRARRKLKALQKKKKQGGTTSPRTTSDASKPQSGSSSSSK